MEASSGQHDRHWLSRAGNRRVNHVIHIAAVTQLRLNTDGRAYHRRKRAQGRRPMEAPGASSARPLDSRREPP
ncbi:MAG TPA: transposase [Dermatophilaceae bacterium]|nr:transposase [Dermatophilaceae bacterium]